MCHHNTFLVYQSMRDASLEQWEKVTHISISFAWVVAALFGIMGYSTFRALSQGTVPTESLSIQTKKINLKIIYRDFLKLSVGHL